jgi:hypothetical protein
MVRLKGATHEHIHEEMLHCRRALARAQAENMHNNVNNQLKRTANAANGTHPPFFVVL